MSVFLGTLKDLRRKAAECPAVLVAFSGGKDSLAVLDLCLRHFARVECFHFEFIAGMQVTRERVTEPLQKLGIPCRYYPDPGALDAYRRGVFCDPRIDRNGLVHVPTEREAYEEAAADAGITLVATGKKKSDYRQRAFHMNAGRVFGWHPIQEWRKKDAVDYLKLRNITPPASHADAGGIDLTAASLRWLRANYPADFRKLLQWFPYAEAAIIRTEVAEAVEAVEAETREGGGADPGPGPEADPVRRVRAGRRAPRPAEECPVQPAADHG